MCLYEHASGKGRRLLVKDDYWQDLGNWGFRHTMSSYRNRQDGAAVRDLYPHRTRYISANSGSTYVGSSWNDDADLVHG